MAIFKKVDNFSSPYTRLVFVGRIEGDLANFLVARPLVHRTTDVDLGELEQGGFRRVTYRLAFHHHHLLLIGLEDGTIAEGGAAHQRFQRGRYELQFLLYGTSMSKNYTKLMN